MLNFIAYYLILSLYTRKRNEKDCISNPIIIIIKNANTKNRMEKKTNNIYKFQHF